MYLFIIDIISKYNKTESNINLKIGLPIIINTSKYNKSNIISKIDLPIISNTSENKKNIIYIKKYLETIPFPKSYCSCYINRKECLMCSPVNEILAIKQ